MKRHGSYILVLRKKEDTQGVKEKIKLTNNGPHNTTHEITHWATGTVLKNSGSVSSPCSTCGTHHVTVKWHQHHRIMFSCLNLNFCNPK